MPEPRTFIAYRGHPNFELPSGHVLDFREDVEMGVATLSTEDSRSAFAAIVDEKPGRLVIKLVGEPLIDDSSLPPYRFPWGAEPAR